MNAVKIKPIETSYKGYRFRSRLEARWAVFFDALGIKYEYEPEGFQLSDGTLYLPDFWLPESKTFFEVKGEMSSDDAHKIEQLRQDIRRPVVIGYSGFQFEAAGYSRRGAYYRATKHSSLLVKCYECGKLYFTSGLVYGECESCGGAEDGIIYLRGDWDDSDPFPAYPDALDAIEKARGARFEYGEKPQILNGEGDK